MSETNKPPRTVGTLGATLISVNGMIGAGIFALPALLYAQVGNFAPWLFLIFGLFYGCTILVVARLATMFESSGGPQLYVQAAFGPVLGFQVGWLMIIGAASARAATLFVLVSYLAVFFPALGEPLFQQLAMLALLAGLSGLTLTGMRNAVAGLVIGTIIKLAPIAAVCLVAFLRQGIVIELHLPVFSQFGSVSLLVYFAFSGAAASAWSAGEIRDPKRTLPRTMLLSLGLIILFYMTVQWAYIAGGAPQSRGDATPLAAAAEILLGKAGVIAITIAAIFSIATNALTFFISSPRVIFGMAERNLIPSIFAHVSPRFLTPDFAILLFTLIVAVLTFSGTFALLAIVLSLTSQIWTICMFGAFVKLQMTKGDHRTMGFMLVWSAIIAVGLAFALYASSQAPLMAFELIAGLILLGLLLAMMARRDKTRATAQAFD